MKTTIAAVLAAAVAGLVLTACSNEHPMGGMSEHPAQNAPAKVMATKAVYVCPECHTLALQAGACPKCGKPMVEHHLLGVKDGQAMLCTCPPGCTCDAKGAKDGKCACGKPVEMVSAKGLYGCACPGGTCCTVLSDKPGKCACGMALKQIE